MIIDYMQIFPTYDGKAEIKLKTSDTRAAETAMEDFNKGGTFTAEIKRKRAKRSIDANAYCWVLCSKIAEKLGAFSDEDIYKEAIRKYGVSTIVPIAEKAAESYCRKWDEQGLGTDCVILGNSKLDGYVNIKCFWGSSTYDSKEMSRLIDGLVADAKDQGIETMTPNEIEKLKQLWK